MFSDQKLIEIYNNFSGINKMSRIEFIGAVNYLLQPKGKTIPTKELTSKTIEQAAFLFNISERLIFGTSRKKDLVKARMFISFYLKSKGYTYSEIGRILNKDHSSIMHQVKTFNQDFLCNDIFKSDYQLFVNSVEAA